jgi:hypothetical protein
MTDSAKELRALSLVLSDHSKALRIAAEAARVRGVLLRERARQARELGYASRKHADAARKRQDVQWYPAHRACGWLPMHFAGLAIRPLLNRPQMAFHQIERRDEACQYLPG